MVAKELFNGKLVKVAADDWNISHAAVYGIWHEFLGHMVYWKKSCTNAPVCTHPLCNCELDEFFRK